MNHHRCSFLFPWICILGATLVATGCWSNNPATNTTAELRGVPVKVVPVATTQLQRTTRQPATVHAYYRAEIRAKVSGFVKQIKADIGDLVDVNAELALIDVPEMQKQREVMEAKILSLEANEKGSKARVKLAAARVQSSKAIFNEAQSQMRSAEASLAAAEAEYNRTQDLVQRGSLQNRLLDEVRLKRDSEAANKEALASAVDSAQAEVGVAEAQFASAEADLAAANAETEIARRQIEEFDVMIDYATIKAPFAGIVSERNIEPGDLVRALSEVGEGEPLFVISQVDKVRVRIPVPESDAPWVTSGDEVTLNFPSFSAEAPIVGTVTRRSGSLDPSTRTMIVEMELPNTAGKLLPGMFGEASINLATKVTANTLPSQAIRFGEGGRAYVYVVGQDDTVSVVPITTGMDDGNSIEVLSGVEPGQRVIGSHLKRFTDGQKVVVVPN